MLTSTRISYYSLRAKDLVIHNFRYPDMVQCYERVKGPSGLLAFSPTCEGLMKQLFKIKRLQQVETLIKYATGGKNKIGYTPFLVRKPDNIERDEGAPLLLGLNNGQFNIFVKGEIEGIARGFRIVK